MRVLDFVLPELESLVSYIADARVHENPATVTRAIYNWTAGHPYLSHCFCAVIADFLKTDRAAPLNFSVVEQLRIRLRDVAASNSDHVVKLSLDSDESVALIRQLLGGETVPFTRGRAVLVRLDLIGAIGEDEYGRCRIRNRLYEETFRQSLENGPARNQDSPRRQTIDLTKLRQVLATTYGMEELKALCDELRIDFENIEGDTLDAKARQLIAYVDRRDNLDLLAQAVKRERPKTELSRDSLLGQSQITFTV